MSHERTSAADIRHLLDTSASDEAMCDAYDRLLVSLNSPSATIHRTAVAGFILHCRPHLAERLLWTPVRGYYEHVSTPEGIIRHAATFGDSDWLSEMVGPGAGRWLRDELPKLTGLLGRLLWEVVIFRRLDALFTCPPVEAAWLTNEVANHLWSELRLSGRVPYRKRALLAVEVCRAGVKLFREETAFADVIRRFEARAAPHFRADESGWPEMGTALARNWLDPSKEENRDLASRVREIFGDPLRRVAFDPSWRTETVVALASAIEAERAFDRLPVLADAVEEAGCDDGPFLDHCRGPGPHVRGCWALDTVLGDG